VIEHWLLTSFFGFRSLTLWPSFEEGEVHKFGSCAPQILVLRLADPLPASSSFYEAPLPRRESLPRKSAAIFRRQFVLLGEPPTSFQSLSGCNKLPAAAPIFLSLIHLISSMSQDIVPCLRPLFLALSPSRVRKRNRPPVRASCSRGLKALPCFI